MRVPPLPRLNKLSRREREIMDILYRDGPASVAHVLSNLPDPPSYSSVRALLRILEEKGHITHVQEGQHYVFEPTHPRQSVAGSALQQVVQTFFGGSVEKAVATLLSSEETRLSADEIARLQSLIDRAKAESTNNFPDPAQTDEPYVSEPQTESEI